MSASSSVDYRPATLADAAALADVGRRSFCETFAHLYAPHDLAAFLEEAYTAAALSRELADPSKRFRLAEDAGQLIGFCKLGLTVSLPIDLGARRGMELKQLYLLRSHLGAGIAPDLLDWALEEARVFGADDVVLSVYCDNVRAQRFYQRYGFEHVGDFFFMVGSHRDPEHLYRLKLRPA